MSFPIGRYDLGQYIPMIAQLRYESSVSAKYHKSVTDNFLYFTAISVGILPKPVAAQITRVACAIKLTSVIIDPS